MQPHRNLSVHDRHGTSLDFRAQHAWPFFSLGLFAAVNLLCCGIYFLNEAIANPRSASEAGIVAGGFMLAAASFAFIYLAWRRVKAIFHKPVDIDPGEDPSHPSL